MLIAYKLWWEYYIYLYFIIIIFKTPNFKNSEYEVTGECH